MAGIPIGIDLDAARAAAEAYQPSIGSLSSVFRWGGLYLLSGWLLFKTSRATSIVMTRNGSIMFLILFALLSALWANYPLRTLINSVHLAGSVMIAMVAGFRYHKEPSLLYRHAGFALGANQAVHLLFNLVFPGETIGIDGRWVGLTGHPNILGAIAFCSVWANFSALMCSNRIQRLLHIIFVVISLINMLGANSITSILVTIVAIGGVLSSMWLTKYPRWRLVKYLLVFTGISLSMVMILALGMDETLESVFELLSRERDFTGRVFVWELAFELFGQRPILGFGFDDTRQNAEALRGFAHFHNGYIKLLIQGGIVAVGILVWFLMRLLTDIRHISRSDSTTAKYLIPFVFAVLIYNLAEPAFFVGRNTVWLVFLVCILVISLRVRPIAVENL